ncbi:hypothetical protein [Saccharothrix hoggarensis]|uniref:Uncharacterized protein n=1 Tax=Saccharothrix hoggarensis TaxID=913853 RepID=A0ABW3QGN9_9PSEU
MTAALLAARRGRAITRPAAHDGPPAGWFGDVDPEWEPARPDVVDAVRDGSAREQAQWIIARRSGWVIAGEWRRARRRMLQADVSPFERDWYEAYFDQLDRFVSLRGVVALELHDHG